MRDNKKKAKKIILLTLLILLILLIVCFLIMKNAKQKVDVVEEEKLNAQYRAEEIESYMEDKVCPRKMSTLYSKYRGKNNKNDLYISFNNFVNYLPDLFKEVNQLDDTQLKNYFAEHPKAIKKYLGLEKEEDFIGFVQYIKQTGYNENKFKYCEIDDTTYIAAEAEKYLTFNVAFTYEGMENPIVLKISFANSTTTNPQVKYNIVK